MRSDQTDFIDCPGCKQKLMATQTRCQFCGADTSKVARPIPKADTRNYKAFETPKWIWSLYYALCTWWVLGGVISILQTIEGVARRVDFFTKQPDPTWTVIDYAVLGVGAIQILVGIALFLKVKGVRNVVNFLAALNLLGALASLAGSIMGIAFAGPYALLYVISNIFDVVVAGGTIWILGETDDVHY